MSDYFIVPGEFGQRVVLIGLAIAWAALLFGGLLRGLATRRVALAQKGTAQSSSLIPPLNQLLSSLTLVLAGWVWLLVTRESTVSGYALLIAIGMTLGFLGDIALAKGFPLPQPLLWGIGLFGIGHICYIVAIMQLANHTGLDATIPRWGAWGFWLLLSVVGWFLVVQRGRPFSGVRTAALLYSFLLGSLAGVTTGLALQDARFIPLALGGALFWTSDLLLAGEQLGNLRSPIVGTIVWLAYGPAQSLIVYSVGIALVVTR